MAKNPLVIICGPTATGKTALAINLAKEFGGETISADSRQVYKGMDVGTGKDVEISNFQFPISKLNNRKVGYYIKDGVKIWGLDLVEPSEKFSVAHWVRFAKLVIQDIWERKHLPIIVGGTGFYIKGLLQGFETLGIRPDWQLRKQLESWTAGQLGSYLRKLDPQRWARMNESDRRNPRRLVRAIEIVKQAQGPKLKAQSSPASPWLGRGRAKLKAKMFMIGLKTDYKTLYQRIDKRVDERVRQGIIKEIKDLLKKGYSWDDPGFNTSAARRIPPVSALGDEPPLRRRRSSAATNEASPSLRAGGGFNTLGYKEFRDFFEKKISLEEATQRWKYDEHKYARRQMTWFRKPIQQAQGKPRTNCLVRGKLQKIHWFDINKKGWQNKVKKKVSDWLS